MKKIFYIVPHGLTPWLLEITRKNYEILVKSFYGFDIRCFISIHMSELEIYSEHVNTLFFNKKIQLCVLDDNSTLKFRHGLLIDNCMQKINTEFKKGDLVILSDSDFFLNDTNLINFNNYNSLLYYEKRPVCLKNEYSNKFNFIPHPCFIFFSVELSFILIQKLKNLSFCRARDTIIGEDKFGKYYGADSCDLIMVSAMKINSEVNILDNNPIHFNGCTEVVRKISIAVKEGIISLNSNDILNYVYYLDEFNQYHDGNDNYYLNGLISTLLILLYSNKEYNSTFSIGLANTIIKLIETESFIKEIRMKVDKVFN